MQDTCYDFTETSSELRFQWKILSFESCFFSFSGTHTYGMSIYARVSMHWYTLSALCCSYRSIKIIEFNKLFTWIKFIALSRMYSYGMLNAICNQEDVIAMPFHYPENGNLPLINLQLTTYRAHDECVCASITNNKFFIDRIACGRFWEKRYCVDNNKYSSIDGYHSVLNKLFPVEFIRLAFE